METLVYKRPESLLENARFTFCPGCGHGVVLKIMAELLDEFKLKGDTITVASVGCSVFLEKFFDTDMVGASHGRSLPVATGVKRCKPDKFVFTYQGDGDCATIGFNETVHTACRGEKLTSIMINNTNFGMTGGQASSTTLLNQVTTTTPIGRKSDLTGYPLHAAEMIAQCDGTAYCARVAITDTKNIRDAKKALRKAFEAQINGLGFGFVEVLTACPTNWHMKPQDAVNHITNVIQEVHPLGVFKDITAKEQI